MSALNGILHDQTWLALLFAVPGFLLSALAAGHALLYKRRPQSALGWITASFLMPYVGPLLYYMFGINRVAKLARKLRGPDQVRFRTPPGSAEPPPQANALARLGAGVSGLPLLGGNEVAALYNGESAFPAMLDAIAGARESVYLSSFIFDHDDTGRAFAAALGSAAARGADVRVLVDGFGEWYSRPRARRLLRGGGIRFASFLPPGLFPPSIHLNLRNHRKILVVDRRVAFSGGMNISDRHFVSQPRRAKPVSDLHFRFTGPVAAQIEDAFLDDWQFVTGDPPREARDSTVNCGSSLCRVIMDGPDGDLDRLATLYVGAAGLARQRIAIMTPYFVPPRSLIGALRAAALRGVDVTILLPANNNLPYVHRATRHMLWELLKSGIDIRYQPGQFVHSKMLLIDADYAMIGSANIDPRSLRLNFELNVEILDTAFVAGLWHHFDHSRARARPICLGEVDARPLPTKVLDGLSWLFSPYL
jgi:cardiolipin synthase